MLEFSSVEPQCEALRRSRTREEYRWHAGHQPTRELWALYQRFDELLSRDLFVALRDLPFEPAEMAPLLQVMAWHGLDRAAGEKGELIAQQEALASVVHEFEPIGLARAGLRVAVEGEFGPRHELDWAIRSRVDELAGFRRDRLIARHRAAQELGYEGERAMWDALYGLDLEVLCDDAGKLLSRTKSAYSDALRDELVFHGLDGRDVWHADLRWVLRGSTHDGGLAIGAMTDAVHRTLGMLGVRVSDLQGLRIEQATPDAPKSGSACYPIDAPGEVHVVLQSVGGRIRLRDLLDMYGQACRYCLVEPSVSFPRRVLGDPAVAEAYGLLFRSLVGERVWLERFLEPGSVEDLHRLHRLERLYEARSLAANVLFDRELDRLIRSDELEAAPELYVEMMTDALGVQEWPECWLLVEDRVAAAHALRARMLEYRLRAFVKSEYDEEWFQEGRSGRFLIDLWRQGQRFTARELCLALGADGLAVDDWIVDLGGGTQ
jgi:hypothetical protein